MFKIISLAALLLAGAIWVLRRRPVVRAEARKPAPLPATKTAGAPELRAALAALTVPGLRGSITDAAAGLTDSRIGGPLAWPKDETLPVDETGRPFVLLAQVNLATLPAPLDLPRAGLLQVLVTADDMFGCEFPSHQNAGMRVVLHAPDAHFVQSPGPLAGRVTSPLSLKDAKPEGHAITWSQLACPPSGADDRLIDLAYPETRGTKAEEAAIQAALDDAALARGRYDIMLRGNPDFTQSDPREDPAFKGMVNLIAFSSTGGAFMWGDMGEACFLIPPEDLPKADLSRVIYYWDCS